MIHMRFEKQAFNGILQSLEKLYVYILQTMH